MTRIRGLWWPDDTAMHWQKAYRYISALDWPIAHCLQHRTAVQAGGNVGLWPLRLAAVFERVLTFEPDSIARACLENNVPTNVTVSPDALGAAPGFCAIKHDSIGSHCVVAGSLVRVVPLDALDLQDVDFLQLDVEGYEHAALSGSVETLRRCRPLVQVELRGLSTRYGQSDANVRALLVGLGYLEASEQIGRDFSFVYQEAA